jgi:hypothetical protein
MNVHILKGTYTQNIHNSSTRSYIMHQNNEITLEIVANIGSVNGPLET